MTCQKYFKGKDVLVFVGAENSQDLNTAGDSLDGVWNAGGRKVTRDVLTAFELPMELTDITSLGVDGFGLEFEDIDVLGRPVPINVDIRNNVAATVERQMSGIHREFFLKSGFENPLGACDPINGTYNDKGNSVENDRGFFDDTYGYWLAARIGLLTTSEIWIVFHNCKIEATPTLNAGGTITESIVFAGRYGEVRNVPQIAAEAPPFDWAVDENKFATIVDVALFTDVIPANTAVDRKVGVRIPLAHDGTGNDNLADYIHVYSDGV